MINGYELISLEALQLPKEELDLISSVHKSDQNIIVFRIINDLGNLEHNWEETQGFVAGNIQANLDFLKINEQIAWNIYIFFLVDFKVPSITKFMIESNKFCCKKYIVNVNDLTDEVDIQKSIKKQIPLFAEFEIGDILPAASSDKVIKEKIFQQSNKSQLANMFLQTPNIDQFLNPEDIKEFINDLLKGEE